MVRKLKNSIVTTQKLKLWQNSKLKLRQNSKTQILTTQFLKNTLKSILVRTALHLDNRWDVLWAAFCDLAMFSVRQTSFVITTDFYFVTYFQEVESWLLWPHQYMWSEFTVNQFLIIDVLYWALCEEDNLTVSNTNNAYSPEFLIIKVSGLCKNVKFCWLCASFCDLYVQTGNLCIFDTFLVFLSIYGALLEIFVHFLVIQN